MRPQICKYVVLAFAVFSNCSVTTGYVCSQETLLQCIQPDSTFTELSFGFATEKEELDLVCLDFNYSQRCIERFAKNCLGPSQRGYFYKLYSTSVVIIQEICEEESLQDEFLRHAECMGRVKWGYNNCARSYQQKMKVLGKGNKVGVCRSFEEFLKCAQDVIQDMCGKESAEYTKGLLERMTASSIQACLEVSSAAPKSNLSIILVIVTFPFLK